MLIAIGAADNEPYIMGKGTCSTEAAALSRGAPLCVGGTPPIVYPSSVTSAGFIPIMLNPPSWKRFCIVT